MPPRVSIIVPVFNAEPYLACLLTSLFSQTESSIEIIAVDDGSTDRSAELLTQAARTDSRLRVFLQANLGLAQTRNIALSHATGEWIAFADSDDWLDANALKLRIDRAVEQDLDVLVGNAFHFCESPGDQPRTPLLKHQSWNEVITGEEWLIRGSTREFPHQVWLQLIRRSCLLQWHVKFIEGIVHEDIPWTLSVALAARRVGFLPAPLYGYRLSAGSVTADSSARAIQLRIQSYLKILPLMAAAAAQAKSQQLRRTLAHQAHDEGTKCLALLRKRLHDPARRAESARLILQSELFPITVRGATRLREVWRALRGFACCQFAVAYARIFVHA